MENEKLKNITSSLIEGDDETVSALCRECVDSGVEVKDILDALISGMNVVGEQFKEGEMYIPEVLVAAMAMTAGMDVIRPLMEESGVESLGKIVVGTVAGDLHDIGKNLVKMMLIGAGFEVIDLGVDVSCEAFVEAVKEYDPVFVGASALLTTTMKEMGELVKAIEAAGLRDKVKILVGGAPITEDFKNAIGADLYAPDAAQTVIKVKEMLGIAQ